MNNKLLKEIDSVEAKNFGVESETKEYIKIMAKISERQSQSSALGMWASIILSIVAIVVSCWNTHIANVSSQEWQTKQLPQLEAINKNTKACAILK